MTDDHRFHPYIHAERTPDKPAIIMNGSGETVSYRQLENASNQGAHLLRHLGLQKGDTIALLIDNTPRFFELAWAAQRSGLYYTFISTGLTAPEAKYIVENSDAKMFIASAKRSSTASAIRDITDLDGYFSVDGAIEGFVSFETARGHHPTTRIPDESLGLDIPYSSGTTGRPKGIRAELDRDFPIDTDSKFRQIATHFGGITSDTVYLSPAPLYHTAPLRWCMAALSIGATVIIMEKFDAEQFLLAVETHEVTNTQVVPTMFVQLLKLPPDVRLVYSTSSLKRVLHAAAPCPIQIKEQMLDWWGPIIHEYYSSSEGYGLTWINSEDWLTHKGSVGKSLHGTPHICGDDGTELPVGEVGTIYYSGTRPPTYYKDPKKSAAACHPNHSDWSTVGDVGRLDDDGFLYLTDRKAFTIISGGVNIYPQEAEDILITHPKVADVAVIGVPNDTFGEEVKGVVQPMPGIRPSAELSLELIEYCQSKLARVKCPRSIDFDPELPRHQTGKLYKKLIRDKYWQDAKSRILA